MVVVVVSCSGNPWCSCHWLRQVYELLCYVVLCYMLFFVRGMQTQNSKDKHKLAVVYDIDGSDGWNY